MRLGEERLWLGWKDEWLSGRRKPARWTSRRRASSESGRNEEPVGTGETARESRTFQPGEETHGWGTVIFKYLKVCRVDKGIPLQSTKQKQPPGLRRNVLRVSVRHNLQGLGGLLQQCDQTTENTHTRPRAEHRPLKPRATSSSASLSTKVGSQHCESAPAGAGILQKGP